METDKATMEWESQEDGFIAKLLKLDGAKDIPVGTNVVVLVEDEASIAAFKDYKEGGGYPENIHVFALRSSPSACTSGLFHIRY